MRRARILPPDGIAIPDRRVNAFAAFIRAGAGMRRKYTLTRFTVISRKKNSPFFVREVKKPLHHENLSVQIELYI